ncbi:hypothetical protein WJX74_008045 [Apatococcus lobatus]|uniref:Uncharacterized protein n=1 Tax=Apatococcus lobatus TaxID=904363 RepID=A0AAW1QYP8_9CHLO
MKFGWLACLPFASRSKESSSSSEVASLETAQAFFRESSLPGNEEQSDSAIRKEACLTKGQELDTAAWQARSFSTTDDWNLKPLTAQVWQDKLPGLDNDFRPKRAISTFPMPHRAMLQARAAQEAALRPGGSLPFQPQSQNVDLHRDFDLAFRDAYHRSRANGTPFTYQPQQAGLCTGVPKAVDAISELADSKFSGNPAFESYVQTCGLHSCHARIQWPDDYQWYQGPRRRIPGTPAFRFNPSNPYHWNWTAVPGTEAGENDWAEGTYHGVAARTAPLPPSDPTIEQFQKYQDVILYLVDSC